MRSDQGRKYWHDAFQLACVLVIATCAQAFVFAAGADSERLSRAKDLIADEQWRRAVAELREAYTDPKEPAKDEVAFWLAHSLHQSGDAAAALEAIEEIEQKFPRSRWAFPARSLKIEIAHRLNRHDTLWHYATPPPPPAPPEAAVPPAPGAPPASPVPPAAPAPHAAPPAPVAPVLPPPPPRAVRPRREWVDLDEKAVDPMIAAEVELRIQALGSLIRLEPARAVPILKEVALNALDIDQARRAMFVLVQSDRTDARAAVAQIAKSGPEPVTIAAVKVLGMSASPETTAVLTDLYFEGTRPVKSQVLRALGAARQPQPLMRIVRTESERPLREIAVAALGQAGARRQLAELYRREPDLKLPVIAALFTASGEDELIAIARTEPDRSLRQQAVARLKLFGTAKARAAVRNLR